MGLFEGNSLHAAKVFAGALAASWAVGFLSHAVLSRLKVLDVPNARSSHATVTVRGGGVGIIAVVVAGGAAALFPPGGWLAGLLWAAVLLVAAVSFLDDRLNLPWKLRLGVQVLAAVAAAAGFCLQFGPAAGWLAAIGVVVMTGYANAFNFMDGINGIAAGQATVTGVGTAWIAMLAGVSPDHPVVILALVVAGAAGGFLPHNFPRARMFMGDIGSVPLGFLLAALGLWAGLLGGWLTFLCIGLLHLNFVLDTAVTMWRRLRRGERLHEAHREHFYQRAVRGGWSHPRTTLTEMALQLVVLGLAGWAVQGGFAAWGGAVVLTMAAWGGFFGWCEATFRRRQAAG
jgi:UDP-GlcNAc:undecaprenyl-phosphate GlcNAc-1-phosphate transferase